jgi:hypothetical protein
MRLLIGLLPASVCLLAGHPLHAADLKSGPQPGERIGCLHVEWVFGGPDPGQTWTRLGVGCVTCYIPEFREPPATIALVFVRKVDDRVVKLVKELDAVVPEYGAIVCGVGDITHKDLKKLEPVATNTHPDSCEHAEGPREAPGEVETEPGCGGHDRRLRGGQGELRVRQDRRAVPREDRGDHQGCHRQAGEVAV